MEQEGIKIDETFQAAALLENLPPSWSKYKKRGKQDDAKLSLDTVIKHIRIEENNRLEDEYHNQEGVKVNVVEHAVKKQKFQTNNGGNNSGGNKGKKTIVQVQKKIKGVC